MKEPVVGMGPIVQLGQYRLRAGSPLPKAAQHTSVADLSLRPELRFLHFFGLPPRGVFQEGEERRQASCLP